MAAPVNSQSGRFGSESVAAFVGMRNLYSTTGVPAPPKSRSGRVGIYRGLP